MIKTLSKRLLPDPAVRMIRGYKRHVVHAYEAYHHFVALHAPASWEERSALMMAIAQRFRGFKRILTYPEVPGPNSVLHKLGFYLGYSFTNDPRHPHQLAIKWEDTTYSPADAVLQALSGTERVVNLSCDNIGKDHVNTVFERVFGYPLGVDPHSYEGTLVRKSKENYAHDGEVLRGPVDMLDEGSTYQRLIDNQVEGRDLVEDIRVPVIGGTIPFVYLKRKPMAQRFAVGDEVVEALLRTTESQLSSVEVQRILRFCNDIGMEYGELDVLRDRQDGRIYIVDANNTPSGPNVQFSKSEADAILRSLADVFRQQFLPTCAHAAHVLESQRGGHINPHTLASRRPSVSV